MTTTTPAAQAAQARVVARRLRRYPDGCGVCHAPAGQPCTYADHEAAEAWPLQNWPADDDGWDGDEE